jgi:hypothetical protein
MNFKRMWGIHVVTEGRVKCANRHDYDIAQARVELDVYLNSDNLVLKHV